MYLKGIIAEQIFLPKYLSKMKKILFADSVAENPLMLIGKLFLKLRVKKMLLAFLMEISSQRETVLFLMKPKKVLIN